MKSTAPMKRTPMKPRKKPMRRRSKKAAKEYAGRDGRRVFVKRILTERPHCEVCPTIASAAPSVGRDRCGGRSVHVHEILPRSAGGSITDERNVLAVCARGHRYIHAHPVWSREHGFLKSRYAR